MKNICIILARGGSKSIPDKNIVDFLGKPLISYSISNSRDSKFIDEVHVSSDSDAILRISERHGSKVIKRPDDISGDTATSESALKHAIQLLGSKNINFVLFLQPTSPLREVKDIDRAVEKFNKQNLDSLFSAARMRDMFIWEDRSGELKSYNYDYKNRKRRQDIDSQFIENGSFYIFKPEILLKSGNRLGGKIGYYLMEEWKQHEIDSPDDLLLCEYLYKRKLQ